MSATAERTEAPINVSRTEAARRLGVSESTLDRLAAEKKGPPSVMIRGRKLYPLAKLLAWSDGQTE
jgi:predicted DNA-binding transcriptional regulator AlpA